MPTQMLSRAEIRSRWGSLLPGFEPAPPGHPIAAGMPAGAVTDDTEQAILLGRLLVKGHGTVDPRELATALVAGSATWPNEARSTSSAPPPSAPSPPSWPASPPEEAGATGATNGAAMRIAPVGIGVAPGDLRRWSTGW